MKRKLAALLALLTIAGTAIGCSQDNSGNSNNDQNVGETTAEVTTEALPESAVPSDVNFDGFGVNVLYFNSDPMFSADDSADIVDAAVLQWQQNVSDRLGVKFNILPGLDVTELEEKYSNSILSGSEDFNFLQANTYGSAKYVTAGYFHNLLDLEYANYDAEWWATEWMNEASVGNDRRYLAQGDNSLAKIRYQSCIYYNKDVYTDYFGDANEMYTIVDEGKWTLDEFYAMSQKIYSDLNGDSITDKGDQLATILHTVNLTDHLAYDTGFRATRRGSDGIPYLEIDSEHNINFTQKLYDIFYNNTGVVVVPVEEAGEANNTLIPNKFKNNELLFALGWFYTSDKFRDMEGDYGLIPFPKYDETQDKYLSLVHDSATSATIPTTVSLEDANKLSAVMEEMAYLGWRDVTPTYYEVALKVKYIRDSDDIALKIVDMIHDGATTDFAYVYNYALGNVGTIQRSMMKRQSADIVSVWAGVSESIGLKFDDLVNHFLALE